MEMMTDDGRIEYTCDECGKRLIDDAAKLPNGWVEVTSEEITCGECAAEYRAKCEAVE